MSDLRKYNVAATILFTLIVEGSQDFFTGAAPVAGDVKIVKDEGASANTTNLPVHEGNGIWSLLLTATEMQAARIAITIIDATATKIFEDQMLVLDTYGNASAQHAFDLDLAEQSVNLARWLASVPSVLSGSGKVQTDLEEWRGTTPAALTAGLRVQSDLEEWRGNAPTALTAAGRVQSDLEELRGVAINVLVAGRIDAIVGAVAANAIGDAGVATDLDSYQAKVVIVDDNAAGNDRYTFTFFRNGQQITSGITVPTVWVYSAAAAPGDLIGTSGAPQALVEAGATETWFHNEATNRIASGTAYFARCRFTVDGAEREWTQPIGRDST